jgi:hypothetical protein
MDDISLLLLCAAPFLEPSASQKGTRLLAHDVLPHRKPRVEVCCEEEGRQHGAGKRRGFLTMTRSSAD